MSKKKIRAIRGLGTRTKVVNSEYRTAKPLSLSKTEEANFPLHHKLTSILLLRLPDDEEERVQCDLLQWETLDLIGCRLWRRRR